MSNNKIEELYFQNTLELLKNNNIDSLLFNISNLKRLKLDELTNETLNILICNNLTKVSSLVKILTFLKEKDDDFKPYLKIIHSNFKKVIRENTNNVEYLLELTTLLIDNKFNIDKESITSLSKLCTKQYLQSKMTRIIKANNKEQNTENLSPTENLQSIKFTM